jgi:stearoyl-CoA 9-desaturase NADPH oxidoreductase
MGQLNVYQPHWVREDFIDFIGEKLDPMWAFKKVKAKLIAKQNLSNDFVQIELRPNHNFHFKTYKAGQSIALRMRIEGVYHQRNYSIVQVLENGDLILAIKQQGKMSTALTNLSLGRIVEISQPQGDFVLKQVVNPIVLLASGSGITAIYALLKQALQLQTAKIDLVYFTRDDAYHAEFKSLSLTYPQFNYHHINTLEQRQHLDVDLLENLVPHFKMSDTYACGAAGMMQALHTLYSNLGILDRLSSEYFQLQVNENAEAQPIRFIRTHQQFEATTNLLSSAEQAGLNPQHGCRMGICNTCSCTKVSGSVKNLLTGEIDHAQNSQIKLCISQALSPVEINL